MQTLITDKEIIREQKDTQIIKIPINEIKSIIKTTKGIIVVTGDSKADTIAIPAQIDDYKTVEQLLNDITPISTSVSENKTTKYFWVIVILTLGLMATVFLSTNKLIVGISGLVLITFLSYSFYIVRKNKNIDNKTKKRMWWLIFVFISIITKIYSTFITTI